MQKFKIGLFLLIIFFSQVSQKAKAQIVPDNTLGSESSVINSTNQLRSPIEGGATRGGNLFHSFQEFNIGEGLEVYFANPEGIDNIFSRVTGSIISEILGTLGVEGNANLFFINPNGIVFGEKAQLDVGGSFVATTADRVEFRDGKFFSARDNEKPLLTWNAPIGLGLGTNPGAIVVRGQGHNLRVQPFYPTTILQDEPGLQVPPGETLALIGGDLILDGRIVKAKSGRIELGSISPSENVTLDINSSGSVINYETVSSFEDIGGDSYVVKIG